MRKLREIEPEIPAGVLAPDEVRIVDYGEVDLRRPDGKPIVRRSIPPRHRRTLAAAGTIALAMVAAWAFFQPRATAAPGSSGSRLSVGSTPSTAASSAHPEASATEAGPSLLPTWSEPTPAPLPIPDGGWVIEVDLPMGAAATIGPLGPDGTIYVGGAAPIDSNGVPRPGWMQLPDGSYLVPEIFGPDGSAYGVAVGPDGSAALWAFGPDGSPRSSFGLPFADHVALEPGPDSSVYLVAQTGAFSPEGQPGYRVVALDRDGTSREFPLPGVPTTGDASSFLVLPDGSMVVSVATGQDGSCATHFLTAGGLDKSTADMSCWSHLAEAPDGSVVGWTCDVVASYTGLCTHTLVARFDNDGRLLSGWPAEIQGDVSLPAFAADGSMYFTIANYGGLRVEMVGLDVDGSTASMYVDQISISDNLPEYQTLGPPTIGNDGTVYVRSAYLVYAYDPRTGYQVPGWPAHLVDHSSTVLVYTHLSDGSGAIGAGGRIVSLLDLRGSTLCGYSSGGADVAPLGILAAPNGVISFGYGLDNFQAYILVAYIPAPGPRL